MSEPTLLVRGGTLFDGTGALGRRADVVVRDGVVAAVLDVAAARTAEQHGARVDAATVIDATGRVVCPGFVDIHTHSDLTLLSNGWGASKIMQGVTTEVVGNCGLGLAPLADAIDLGPVRQAVGYLDLDPQVAVTWRSFDGYLEALGAAPLGPNVAAFAPHLPIRASVLGLGDRQPDTGELDRMCGLLNDAVDAGAVGLSTGLVYAPLCFAPEKELVALAHRVAARDRLFARHVRDYADELLTSVGQALRVARATGCRTQISHLTAVGRRNWGSVRRALDAVGEARADGLDVAVDMYPYLAGNAPLSQLLPSWAQVGGNDRMRAVAGDPLQRKRIRAQWNAGAGQPTEWHEIVVNRLPETADGRDVGLTVLQVAQRRGVEPDEAVLDLLAEHGAAVLMIAFGRGEADLRTVFDHPASVVASDGQALDPHGVTGAGLPHPRCYGTFPRYLARYASDLADGIRRCTSAPADRVGLRSRGRIAVGLPADLLVLDPDTLADTATFEDPHHFPLGIDAVVVAGRLAVHHGSRQSRGTGTVLRR